jgi:hypothetical protein
MLTHPLEKQRRRSVLVLFLKTFLYEARTTAKQTQNNAGDQRDITLRVGSEVLGVVIMKRAVLWFAVPRHLDVSEELNAPVFRLEE